MTPTKEEIQDFSKAIMQIAHTKKLSHLEAIVFWCESKGIDIEMAAKLTNENLKARLRKDGENLHILKKKRRGLI